MHFRGKEFKGSLTNEGLSKQFKSQFELVNYAIKLAENMIKTGRDPLVFSDSQNTAMHVVAEIAEGKDHLEDIFLEQQAIDEKTAPNINGKITVEEEEKVEIKKSKVSKAKKS